MQEYKEIKEMLTVCSCIMSKKIHIILAVWVDAKYFVHLHSFYLFQ